MQSLDHADRANRCSNIGDRKMLCRGGWAVVDFDVFGSISLHFDCLWSRREVVV